MDRKQHWEKIYSNRDSGSLSWFQEHADQSLRLIHNTRLGRDAAIVDVGGGTSRLVDDLMAEGYTDLTVLDLSAVAINVAKQRMGEHADVVQWMEGDVTCAEFPIHRFDIWHDRAVFHFLTDPAYRRAYVDRVMRSVRPGGHVIVATFADDGPEKCSGLPVMRYCPERLHAEFGDAFLLAGHEKETHYTPSGVVQQFVYCYCRMI